MQSALYSALKTEIQNNIPEIKTVGLFNNQFAHSNGNGTYGRDQNPFLYPCVFIEFNNQNFRNLSQGVQQYDSIVSLHLGFESYKDEDIYVLNLKDKVYKTVERFQNSYYSLLTRVAERQDFNHDNIQVYVTDYATTGKDYLADIRPSTQIPSGTTLLITATTINLSAITY